MIDRSPYHAVDLAPHGSALARHATMTVEGRYEHLVKRIHGRDQACLMRFCFMHPIMYKKVAEYRGADPNDALKRLFPRFLCGARTDVEHHRRSAHAVRKSGNRIISTHRTHCATPYHTSFSNRGCTDHKQTSQRQSDLKTPIKSRRYRPSTVIVTCRARALKHPCGASLGLTA